MHKHVTHGEDNGKGIEGGIVGFNWYKTRTLEAFPKKIRLKRLESHKDNHDISNSNHVFK